MAIAIIVLLVLGFLVVLLFPELLFEIWGDAKSGYPNSERFTPRGQCCPEVAGNTGSMPWGDHNCEHRWKAGAQFPDTFDGHGREAWEAEFSDSRRYRSFSDRFRTCQKCGRVEQYLSTCNHWGF